MHGQGMFIGSFGIEVMRGESVEDFGERGKRRVNLEPGRILERLRRRVQPMLKVVVSNPVVTPVATELFSLQSSPCSRRLLLERDLRGAGPSAFCAL